MAAISLLLVAATAVMWVRSYWRHDSFDASASPTTYFAANTHPGGFSARLLTGQQHTMSPPSITSYAYLPSSQFAQNLPFPRSPGRRMGYGFLPSSQFAQKQVVWPRYASSEGADYSHGTPIPNMTRRAEMPYWVIVIIAIAMPARWIAVRRRENRASRVGLCRVCGYDLCATPDRCPECGAVP